MWRVTYTVEDSSLTNTKGKKEAKGFGMDWTDRKVKEKVLAGAASEGGRAMEVVEADLARMEGWWNKTEWTMEERFSVPPGKLNSMVVKLSSGSVLLYAPVRVRDEVGFGAWLESLGRVEWIVVASSFHTLFLASVLARFPEAKVVGAPQAQDKLAHVGGLPRGKFDYISTSKEDLARLNKELEGEGVQVYSVEGEIMCDSLMVVAHGIMLTCDLTYGRHDGGIFFFSREELDLYREEHTGLRLFKYLICNKPHSPNGVLAKYRCAAGFGSYHLLLPLFLHLLHPLPHLPAHPQVLGPGPHHLGHGPHALHAAQHRRLHPRPPGRLPQDQPQAGLRLRHGRPLRPHGEGGLQADHKPQLELVGRKKPHLIIKLVPTPHYGD